MNITYLSVDGIAKLREAWIDSFTSDNSDNWKDEYDITLELKDSLLYRIESTGFYGEPDHRLNEPTYVAIADDSGQTIALAQIILSRRGREHTTKIMSLTLAPHIEIAEKSLYDHQYANALAYVLAFYVAKNNVKGSITKVYAEDEAAQAFLKDTQERLSKDELRKHSIEVALQGVNWLSFRLLKSN